MSHKAFLPANRASSVLPMCQIFHTRPVDGQVGIEIELEGNKFKKEYVVSPWAYVEDHSLRGEDNAEYILRSPIQFDEVPESVRTLWDMIEDYGTVLDDSNRTSVHVHLNFGQAYKDRVCCFVSLFYIVEEILMEWCGDHRIGNLFCLRGKDAPGIVTKIRDFLSDDERGVSAVSEGLHYANLNIHALAKLGSIEIRGMRGAMDPETVITWVSILERIYKLSNTYDDPRQICEGLSGQGPLQFVKHILGEHYELVRAGISFTDQQVTQSAWEGIRLAQDLCYCRDWSKYVKPDLASDPFGRREVQENPYGTAQAQAVMEAWHGSTGSASLAPPFQQEYTSEPDYESDDFVIEDGEW